MPVYFFDLKHELILGFVVIILYNCVIKLLFSILYNPYLTSAMPTAGISYMMKLKKHVAHSLYVY